MSERKVLLARTWDEELISPDNLAEGTHVKELIYDDGTVERCMSWKEGDSFTASSSPVVVTWQGRPLRPGEQVIGDTIVSFLRGMTA